MVLTDCIHRWLRGDDAWPPDLVSRLFARLNVSAADVIYDPFVGWGTTALVAHRRELRSISTDRSALAVLTTACKIHPPHLREITALRDTLCSCNFESLLRDLTLGAIANQMMRFVLAAGLARSRWFAGAALDVHEVHTSALCVLREMADDISVIPPGRATAQVLHAEFGEQTLPVRSAVIVTSLPFSKSNANPRRQKLEAVLGGTNVYDNQQYDYGAFLTRVAEHAAALRCRALAVELESVFTDQFVRRLETLGFDTRTCDELGTADRARIVFGELR